MTDLASLRILAVRLGGSRRMWRPMILPAAVALLFTAFYTVLCGFALSGEQSALRDLGRADHRLSIGVSPGDTVADAQAQQSLMAGLHDVGASKTWARIQSFDLRPDSIPRPLTTGKSRTVSYVEGSELNALFPGARDLTEGEWPGAAGEVAISTALRDRLEAAGDLDGQEFTAFSGLVTLRVTGVYTNVFAESGYEMVAAPGTWAALPAAAIDDRFTGTGALLSIYWSGPAGAAEVANVVAEHSPSEVSADQLMTGLVDRSGREKADDLSLVDTANFIFTLPFVALATAALAMAARAVMAWAGGSSTCWWGSAYAADASPRSSWRPRSSSRWAPSPSGCWWASGSARSCGSPCSRRSSSNR